MNITGCHWFGTGSIQFGIEAIPFSIQSWYLMIAIFCGTIKGIKWELEGTVIGFDHRMLIIVGREWWLNYSWIFIGWIIYVYYIRSFGKVLHSVPFSRRRVLNSVLFVKTCCNYHFLSYRVFKSSKMCARGIANSFWSN